MAIREHSGLTVGILTQDVNMLIESKFIALEKIFTQKLEEVEMRSAKEKDELCKKYDNITAEIEHEVSDLKSTNKTLLSDIQTLKDNNKDLQTENEKLKLDIDNLTNDNRKLRKELDDLKKTCPLCHRDL